MLIPLDYYRILGVPTQANSGQLTQAYHDRSLQLPRREYSDAAISARKHLLDEAYEVLSDETKRSEYEQQNFVIVDNSPPPSPTPKPQVVLPLSDRSPKNPLTVEQVEQIPFLEVDDQHLIGALLLLQELGEYELILKLGEPLLHTLIVEPENKETASTRSDLILTLAIANLELAREQWHQGEYEKAAISGQKGDDLLQKPNLFPNLRQEIQIDLDKLKPYRILELLANSSDEGEQKQKGLQLLQEMLDHRQGIDGHGDDGSGLNIDDFLRFIQQVRTFLTVAEQQELFEAESKRPSAVAIYLAVYALIARGFGYQQPALIVRAQELLQRLAKRQDVHLEQAVCALLLGQTEKCGLLLSKSKESEPLQFIRENSKGSIDLLPGLCMYGELWLATEVFPQFQDLADQQASLKHYFADEKVQMYLEDLARDDVGKYSDATSSGENLQQMSQDGVSSQAYYQGGKEGRREGYEQAIAGERGNTSSYGGGGTATLTATPEDNYDSNSNLGSNTVPNFATGTFSYASEEYLGQQQIYQPERGQGGQKPMFLRPQDIVAKLRQRLAKKRLKLTHRHKNIGLLVIIGIMGLGLSALIYQLIKGDKQLQLTLNEPPIAIPQLEGEKVTSDLNGNLSNELALITIKSWLTAKSKALGSDYKVEQLNLILAQPLLSRWRSRSETLKRNQDYYQYQHSIKILSFKQQDANHGIVEAQVREIAKFYNKGKLNQNRSYDDNLLVRYHLVKGDKNWLIQEVKLLKNL